MFYVEETDSEMNIAIEKANKTLDDFKNALQSNNPNCQDFSIKMTFDTKNGKEHIWLNNIELKDDNYSGTINNIPVETDVVKLGDTIKILKERISDWMYSENGKMRGGYTIRAIRKNMTEIEKQELEKVIGLKIE